MILILIGLIIICYTAILTVQFLRYKKAARAAAKITTPYNRLLKNASQHMLVLGDSTMYGAGVKNRDKTVGGLLAAAYPRASVETLAKNGARVKNLPQQLAQARYSQYDLVLIGIGGNDIVQLTASANVRRDLTAFLAQTSKICPKIILCHSVNIGNIGFFPFPLNIFYDYRSRRLSQLYAEIAAQLPHVTYVNFYRPRGNDHYNKATRKNFLADDGFHPNDAANEYFFNEIMRHS